MVGFNPSSYIVQEGSFTYLGINITGDSEIPVVVTLSSNGETATGLIIELALDIYTLDNNNAYPSGGEDYIELTDVSVIFSPRVVSRRVILNTLSDTIAEGDEYLIATLSTSGTRIAVNATVTITENSVLLTLYICTYIFCS